MSKRINHFNLINKIPFSSWMVFALCAGSGVFLGSCSNGGVESYDFRLIENLKNEDSPIDLWLTRAIDGRRILKIDSGARLEVGGILWNSNKTAVGVQVWRGSKISEIYVARRKGGEFELVTLNEPDFAEVAARELKQYSSEKISQMEMQHLLLRWDDNVLKIKVIFSGGEKDDNIVMECRIDVSKKEGGVMTDSIQGHIPDKDV